MAISDKLNYLIETKSQLKDMINYGLPTENQITNETTFRNYVKGIFEAFLESLRDSTTLYTNLPKISGNGTQITLNDTANAPMRITLKASELSQDATPTPSSPQDIHTISGDNSVVVEGKNLFDKDTITDNYRLGNNGSPYSDNSYKLSDYIRVNANTTYSYSRVFALNDNNGSPNAAIAFYDKDKAFISRTMPIISRYDTSGTITTPNNAEYARFADKKTVSNIQLEEGNQATTYEPYVSQTAPINLDTIEYCKIGDYEDVFILTSGKNLLNIDNLTFTTGNLQDGGNIDTYNQNYKTSNFINLSDLGLSVGNSVAFSLKNNVSGAGTTNRRFQIYDNSNNVLVNKNLSAPTIETISTTATIPENATKIRFAMRITDIEIMLNEGTTALPYEPYGTNQWYLKKNIGKYDLGEIVYIFENSTSTPVNRTIIRINQYNNPNLEIKQKTTYLSNIFNSSEQNDSTKPNRFVTNSSDNWFVSLEDSLTGITSSDDNTTKVTKMKTYLENSNAIVYTYLSTPTYTQITGTLETQLNNIYKNMLSYKGTTNISQVNNDLPFVLGVSAIQDL